MTSMWHYFNEISWRFDYMQSRAQLLNSKRLFLYKKTFQKDRILCQRLTDDLFILKLGTKASDLFRWEINKTNRCLGISPFLTMKNYHNAFWIALTSRSTAA